MKENTTATGPVKVYNANDSIDAQRIIDLLKDENIIAFSQGSGSGDYLSISQGFSVYGVDIYVDASDVESAKAIIAENTFPEDEMEVDDEPVEEDTVEVPFYRNRTKVARIIIGYFVLMAVVVFILNHFL